MSLVHQIRQGWARNLDTSVLLFDLSQFFPSVQYEPMLEILHRDGFSSQFCDFMSSYLTGRTTQFDFGGELTPEVPFNVGLGQGSCLSPILM